jgi:hypothetical protein
MINVVDEFDRDYNTNRILSLQFDSCDLDLIECWRTEGGTTLASDAGYATDCSLFEEEYILF